ncbi:sarcosine dehydrogenase [Paraburkholderia acidicola]|uniref:Sarcosine dehydrogenase n=1 Tax=Paraburkholderia acidicola TaxID=1912599 RepID=A0A2A4ESN9_9BURK|nr:FAD-dependent oxidoreductase [Paraburkholderia acidicola]PCE23176.1 sarcosine dehydrogenase [Paraburkholderia acidicola]
MDIPQRSEIVIIGGGVIGCSIAWHLAKRGRTDVVLLERLMLTHGTTWHAAGLVGQLRSSNNLTRLMKYGANLYRTLEAETGQSTGWHGVGSLRLAASEDRWSELKRSATAAKGFGLDVELISPADAQKLFPLMDIDGLVGAAWIESDGYVDPSQLTQAYAAGARAMGVKIIQNVLVTNLHSDGRRVKAVETDQGIIEADVVINCAGMWGRDIARMAGIRVPVCAVEHQYLVTEKSARVPDNLPTLRDPDARFYIKPEPGALCVGGWEDATVPWGSTGTRPMPLDFGPELLQPSFDRFEQYGLDAAKRIPVLNELGMRDMINGPIPITADGEPIIGRSPAHDNFYLCCGFTSGIAASGGAGSVMSNWIIDGDPGMDLWPFDVRRFGQPHVVEQFMIERAIESYARYYAVSYPGHENTAARNARCSPLYETLKMQGAVYGSKFAYERPNWFATGGILADDAPSFGRGRWFEAVGNEHRAVRERAALIDMSSFSKYEVTGPGALPLLQYVCASNMDRPIGTVIYTQMLNERGGIEGDVTITRLAPERFYFVTGSALGVRDRSTLEAHVPAIAAKYGAVSVTDVSSAYAVVNLCGPYARDILAKLTSAPLDNDAFPYMSAREIDIGYAPVRALRVTYVGELGWELHVPTEYAQDLYRKLHDAGKAFGVANVGYRAISSLRIEKHFLVWGSDISPDYNPYEAGLGFCVAADKLAGNVDFIAGQALAAIKRDGPKRKLCWFSTVGDVPMFGGETLLREERVVGGVTSADYGFTVGKNIFAAYIGVEELEDREFTVEIMGARYPATRHDKPLYDPQRTAVLK